jgi:hypothetical protein
MRGLTHHDAFPRSLQPRREIGHVAGDQELLDRFGGGHGLAGGHANPESQPDPVLLLEHGIELPETLDHGHGGPHRALGVVLVDPGHPEDGHHRVPRILLHGPAEGLDVLAHLVEEGREQGAEMLRIVTRGKLGRAGQVGEEDGDGLAFVRAGHQRPLL